VTIELVPTTASSGRYKAYFLGALTVATLLPTIVSVVNFSLFGNAFSPVVFFLSVIFIMSSAHVWITLAYYLDVKWLRFFAVHPRELFLAPAAILIGSVLLIGAMPKWFGVSFMYLATFINIWHHSKQNWGILSMVSKTRGASVNQLRSVIVFAWPFFLIPWAQYVPELRDFIGANLLHQVSIACGLAYLAFFASRILKLGPLAFRDPFLLTFIAIIGIYFVPMAMFDGSYLIPAFPAAHALQYYTIVLASLTLRDRTRPTIGTLKLGAMMAAVLAGITVTAYLFVHVAAAGSIWADGAVRYFLGVLYGVNLVHFWVDAFIWKFSDADVRKQHGEAFAF